MALEITGKVVKVLTLETGEGKTGNTWTKQGFVIETEDQYPKKICFNAWGDKVQQVGKMKEGDKVKVSFDASSREYNERWFTDLSPWKIESLGASSAPDSAPASGDDFPTFVEGDSNTDDLPF